MVIRKVGVVGCGLMGHGIVQIAAQGGCEVTALETEQRFLDAGLARIDKSLAKLVVEKAGVPTPPFAVVKSAAEASAVKLAAPLFAKPIAEGTSNPRRPRASARRAAERSRLFSAASRPGPVCTNPGGGTLPLNVHSIKPLSGSQPGSSGECTALQAQAICLPYRGPTRCIEQR